MDIKSGKLMTSLYGHDDFGFSIAWHPNGQLLATGNQDKTCKIWDLRYVRNGQDSFSNSGEAYCLKTLDTLVGASAHIKFIGEGGEMLGFSETIDHIQIFDTKTFTFHQDIDIFGEITGWDTYNDRLFIGLKEDNISCLMEYQLNKSQGGQVKQVNTLIL